MCIFSPAVKFYDRLKTTNTKNIMTKKVLVTGSNTVIGKETVKKFAGRGVGVKTARFAQNQKSRKKEEKFDAEEIDYSVPEGIRAILAGVDTVVLITPSNSNQVPLVEAVVREAKAVGVSHIIRVSLAGAGQHPMSLANIHAVAEDVVASSGLPYTVLRPRALMQNFLHTYGGMIQKTGKLSMSLGLARVSFVDARDVAEAVVSVALNQERQSETAHVLTGPEALSGYDLAQLITHSTGHPVHYAEISPEAHYSLLVSAGYEPWWAAAVGELEAYHRSGYASWVSGALPKLLGQPATSFQDFLADHEAYFRSL